MTHEQVQDITVVEVEVEVDEEEQGMKMRYHHHQCAKMMTEMCDASGVCIVLAAS